MSNTCIHCLIKKEFYLSDILNKLFINLSYLSKFESISIWAKLSANLTHVKFDSYSLNDALGFCDSGYWDDDDEYYSKYMTALTRFIYIYNIVENIFSEFGDKNLTYDRNKSTKAIDYFLKKELVFPDYFLLLLQQYHLYLKKNQDKITGKKILQYSEAPFSNNICLKIIKELRNEISHGNFEIVLNPDYHLTDYSQFQFIKHLLNLSNIVVCIYTQVYCLNNFNYFDSKEIVHYLELNLQITKEEYFQNVMSTLDKSSLNFMIDE